MKKLIYFIATIIVIIGIVLGYVKGFNKELIYSSRQQIVINSEKELDVNKIQNIAKDILVDRKINVQNVDRFGKTVEINATTISEEEKKNIINKVNEEYEITISEENVNIESIPNTRIRDILKPYILPAVIAFVGIILYFMIIYHKIGLKEVLLKVIIVPILAELTYYALILITRIPFGRITNGVAIGIFMLTIFILISIFQTRKEEIEKKDKKEND